MNTGGRLVEEISKNHGNSLCAVIVYRNIFKKIGILAIYITLFTGET